MPNTIFPAQAIERASFTGNQWRHEPSGNASIYGTSYLTCDTGLQGPEFLEPPRLDLQFFGSNLDFIGKYSRNLKIRYSVDGGEVQDAVMPSDESMLGKDGASIFDIARGNYQNDVHNITVWPYEGVLNLDCLLARPRESQTKSTDELYIDDKEDLFGQFSAGDWANRQRSPELPFVPLRNSWMNTRTKGAWVDMNITGNSITLRGPVQQTSGILRVKYVLDGDEASAVVTTHSEGSTQDGTWKNQALYTSPTFSESKFHSLRATVEEITGEQSYNVDFLVYTGYIPPRRARGSTINLSVPAIVGIAIGSFFGFSTFVLFTYLFMGRRKAAKAERNACQSDTDLAEVIRLHEMGNDNLQRAADVESPNHVSAAPPPWSPPTLSADAHFTGHYAHDTDHHQQQGDNATYNTASPTFESTQDEMAHPEGTRNHGRDNMAIPPGLDDGFSSQDPPHHGRDPPPYSGTVP